MKRHNGREGIQLLGWMGGGLWCLSVLVGCGIGLMGMKN